MRKKNKKIRLNFIVTEDEKEKIFKISENKGFHNVSEYCRFVLLNGDFDIKIISPNNTTTIVISSNSK